MNLQAETAKAAALRAVLAPFSKTPRERSDRELATQFHKLAMAYVRNAIERRRWLKALQISNPSAARFYGCLWTPATAALVASYRDKARHYRRSARAAVSVQDRRAA